MNKNLFFAATVLFALTACQQNPSVASDQAAKPSAKAPSSSSPQTLPSVIPSPAATVVAKIYNGRGVVTQVELEKGWVEVDHEKIGDFMPAMIMQFNVSDEAQLKALKVGDKVDFVLEDKAGAERLVSIKKR